MTTLCSGIDEAGYGPLLGPLAVVAVSAEVDEGVRLRQAFARARTGVKDSKQIHTAGDIAAIERVALAGIRWLTGTLPLTAGACFALLGERSEQRSDPWMADADRLRLPLAADRVPDWTLTGVRPVALQGVLIHPAAMNQARARGINRASLELGEVSALLAAIPDHLRRETVCDRLGGRRFYGDVLAQTWPEATVTVLGELPMRSAYRVEHLGREHELAFCVEGEQLSPLTALAGCIAKYARELHMHLFNAHWGQRIPDLKPTAGYAQDAKRWLGEVGEHQVAPLRDRLVRSGSEVEAANEAIDFT
ncbi:MAG: hypothetical protein H0W72_01605 [Planctomycetes bacterium]|nr:hypothetical protein [Planctomycetota bacterium]